MKKFTAKIVAFGLSLGILATSFNSYATQNSLNEAEQKKKELVESLNSAKELVESLSDSKDSVEQKISELNRNIKEVEYRGQEIENELNLIVAQVESLKEKIEENKIKIQEMKQAMANRIVYSYENGRVNMLDALFHANTVGELLNIMQYSMDLARYDQGVLDAYEEILQVLSKEEDALAEKQEDAERIAKENEEAKAALSVLKKAEEAEVAKLNQEITDAAEVARIYAEEVKAQEEVLRAIRAAIEEEKRRQEAQGGNAVTGTGVFTWPCPSSRRITSEFGMRESPTAGASTNHKGIDIGAPRGSDIVAADSGKVILSTFSNSAGNYIIVSHGKNAAGVVICSVYMHADSRLVNVGDTVTKGQKIATVGSTGYSTGPHLHFGVTEDGVYVNPWGYL